MRFQTKIFISALTILVLTISLNSVLSISSFEHVYLKSLISTYEAGGKNLKRKIEQSLSFGKPLDNFEGMEKLLKNFLSQNEDIKFSGILDSSDKILYHSDISKKGETFKDIPTGSTDIPETKIIDNSYVIFIPIFSPDKKSEGFLFFGFPKKTVTDKIMEMVISNLRILAAVIPVTALILIFLLFFFIVIPLKSKIRKIVSIMDKRENNFHRFKETDSQNEIYNLEKSIHNFTGSFFRNMTQIESIKNDFSSFKKETLLKISESDHALKKFLNQNPDNLKIQYVYNSFQSRNRQILNYIHICSLLIESDDQTGHKNEI
jgi:hypothetical protein